MGRYIQMAFILFFWELGWVFYMLRSGGRDFVLDLDLAFTFSCRYVFMFFLPLLPVFRLSFKIIF